VPHTRVTVVTFLLKKTVPRCLPAFLRGSLVREPPITVPYPCLSFAILSPSASEIVRAQLGSAVNLVFITARHTRLATATLSSLSLIKAVTWVVLCHPAPQYDKAAV
jgi:hypothetical protein